MLMFHTTVPPLSSSTVERTPTEKHEIDNKLSWDTTFVGRTLGGSAINSTGTASAVQEYPSQQEACSEHTLPKSRRPPRYIA